MQGTKKLFERTVRGKKQYKWVEENNLKSRLARAAYKDAGWTESAGKTPLEPIGIEKAKATKPKKQAEPQPEPEEPQGVEV